jgi:hypothetical protein
MNAPVTVDPKDAAIVKLVLENQELEGKFFFEAGDYRNQIAQLEARLEEAKKYIEGCAPGFWFVQAVEKAIANGEIPMPAGLAKPRGPVNVTYKTDFVGTNVLVEATFAYSSSTYVVEFIFRPIPKPYSVKEHYPHFKMTYDKPAPAKKRKQAAKKA